VCNTQAFRPHKFIITLISLRNPIEKRVRGAALGSDRVVALGSAIVLNLRRVGRRGGAVWFDSVDMELIRCAILVICASERLLWESRCGFRVVVFRYMNVDWNLKSD
jgi:hypothetical protein